VRYNHSQADSIQRSLNLAALSDAKATADKMCGTMDVKRGRTIFLSNYQGATPGDQMISRGGNYELNVFNKGFGGSGFMITTEILQFQSVAFAAFEIIP
jgi:uncharacterized protein